MMIKLIQILAILTTLVLSAQQQKKIEEISIEGNINEMIVVQFPWDNLLEVKVKNDTIPDYVTMVEQRFKLVDEKKTQLMPWQSLSALSQIRRPFTMSRTRLFNIGQSLIIFQKPCFFKVVEEQDDQFIVVNDYNFNEMMVANVHISVIEDHFIMILISNTQIILFNETNHIEQKNPFNTTQAISIKKIFVSDFRMYMTIIDGNIYLFRIQAGEIKMETIQQLSDQGHALTVTAFERGRFFKDKQQIWLVDQDQGLLLMVVSHQLKIVSRPVLIEKQAGCYQLDTKSGEHSFEVLLTCRNGDSSSFKVLYFDNDNSFFPLLLQKVEPLIQKCMSERFIFFRNYIFSLQDSSIDVFVPAKDVDSQSVYDKYWVGMDDLTNYLVLTGEDKQNLMMMLPFRQKRNEKIFVFGLSQGSLYKKELVLQKFTLLLNSPAPLTTTVGLEVDYLCTIQDKNVEELVCSSDTLLHLNIHNKMASYVQYKSINLGIVFILFTVLFALFLLCRYKYKSIHRAAYNKFKKMTDPDRIQI